MSRTALPVALALAFTALPTEAEACGGFFCSNEPMDQSKERIVFAIDDNEDKVEAHIQIFYQGDAADFSWVVPVPSIPDVGLSTDELFEQLEWRTAPTFNLEWKEEGECEWDLVTTDDFAEADVATGAPEDGGRGGGVEVVAKAQVGPYDQVTLQADDTGALLTWLQDNDYDIPDAVGDALAPYVAGGAYFVALKLTNDSDAGDIAPLKMTYTATSAMIPIVLTRIAATPDMRLQPYIFAQHRAVPDNYLHVKINEAAIDWLGWGSNYDKVITEAANEAGGQAFATDFAGDASQFQGMLWSEGRYDLDQLRTQTNPAEFVSSMLGQGFRGTAAVQNILRDFIPMPASAVAAGIDEQSFYNCLDCYPEYVEEIDFDPAAMADALDEVIVTPMREAETLFSDYPFLTRMTSSMSPDEMTLDPYFVQNADMGEVSNQSMADLVIDCTDGSTYSEANRKIVLRDGREILGPPESWFWDSGTTYAEFAEGLDATNALVIEKTSASGLPELLTDNSSLVDDAIDNHNDRVRDLLGLEGGETGAGCGCSSSNGMATGVWPAALLMLLGLGRRRR